ncbi:hypothetical protein [Paraburkholderia sp. GAS82]|uniref:hypothetical protein n=1 Tax=Paraburkholderia sp. GAS82 TaxID=3035137 RepID=UPI003D1CF768
MYLDGRPHDEIRKQTGKSREEVGRLIRRCLQPADDGQIFGFRALVPGTRVNGYIRKAPLNQRPHGQPFGDAGALGMMFRRFPELEESIERLILKKPMHEQIPEARIQFSRAHKYFLAYLKRVGVRSDEWPFQRKDQAKRTLHRHCMSIRDAHLERWVWARSGEDAARRRNLGRGYRSLMEARRPYSMMQLDFHKVDAASIISITDKNFVDHDYPVARWFFGMLVDEFTAGICGVCIALDRNPSADSTLETLESAITPWECGPDDLRMKFTPDGKILVHDLVPELAGQAFPVLRVDNAWSNSATDVVNIVMDVIGCAINFGPVRAWWLRSLIERIFGKLTDAGLKRLPSTFGSGPADTTRADPIGKAEYFRIHLDELVAIIYGCVRDHNLASTEHLHGASPIRTLISVVGHPEHPWLPQPVPRDTSQNCRLLWHEVECFVRGDISKNDQPYVRADRCRYRNDLLSQKYELVGKRVLVRISRRDARVAFAVVIDTGEILGFLRAEKRWSNWPHTYQERKIINRATPAEDSDRRSDPLGHWATEKKEEMLTRKVSRRGRRSSAGNALALAKRSKAKSGKTATSIPVDTGDLPDPEPARSWGNSEIPDVFGLTSVETMKPVWKDDSDDQ